MPEVQPERSSFVNEVNFINNKIKEQTQLSPLSVQRVESLNLLNFYRKPLISACQGPAVQGVSSWRQQPLGSNLDHVQGGVILGRANRIWATAAGLARKVTGVIQADCRQGLPSSSFSAGALLWGRAEGPGDPFLLVGFRVASRAAQFA